MPPVSVYANRRFSLFDQRIARPSTFWLDHAPHQSRANYPNRKSGCWNGGANQPRSERAMARVQSLVPITFSPRPEQKRERNTEKCENAHVPSRSIVCRARLRMNGSCLHVPYARSAFNGPVSHAHHIVSHLLTGAGVKIVSVILKRAWIVQLPAIARAPHGVVADTALMRRCRTHADCGQYEKKQARGRCTA